jgi:Tol biopolymer transport system component
MILDLSTCTITSTIVNLNNGTWYEVLGISYSQERDELVYGVSSWDGYNPMTYQLILLEMDTGKETFLGEGFYPQWSPDSTQIAYVGVDGLYLMYPDGSNQQQLLSHTFVGNHRCVGVIVTLPRWTPDGEWLLYHRCGIDDCAVSDNSIYRLSILTGQEEMIIDGGAYPAWRP